MKLNEIKNRIGQSAAEGEKPELSGIALTVTVIDFDGTVLYSNSRQAKEMQGFDAWLNHAYKNGCVIMDFSQGKILVERPKSHAAGVAMWAVAVFSAVLAALLFLYNAYIQKTMFAPFKRLEGFAASVAAGNLDAALPMDKRNAFGKFSESFDIMRAELKKSKEKEIELEKSKKQLVAELSHDIKTPIASIKAVAEVLALREADEKKRKDVGIIHQKAAEMDALVTDLFNSALQDLSELKITAVPVASDEIARIVTGADYLSKIGGGVKIPDCLVLADPQRFSQIVGNIVGNSYKYADTQISVTAEIVERCHGVGLTDSGGDSGNAVKVGCAVSKPDPVTVMVNRAVSKPDPVTALAVEFRDYGEGVADEELPLITQRFYRGKNSQKSAGSGLGLYICKLLLQRMGGFLDCYNTGDGLAVKVFLRLA